MNLMGSPAAKVDSAAPGARVAGEATEAAAATNVRELFNGIAPTYDRLNHLLSFGLDRHWWRKTARTLRPVLQRPEARVLDICCGTGDLTAALLAERPPNSLEGAGLQPRRSMQPEERGFSPGGNPAAESGVEPITGLDFSAEMLARARTKYAGANAVWVEGDAMHLPYPDASFDLVTAAFGFRNLSNYAAGLAELHRVLRPGGQIGILECNQPSGLAGWLYNLYFRHILPVVGGWLSGDRAAYAYLPASVARFPRPPRMFELLRQAGLADPTWDRYLLGAAGLYRAVKPS